MMNEIIETQEVATRDDNATITAEPVEVTACAFNLSGDHGIDPEAAQVALDHALECPYFADTPRAAIDTGTLIGPVAVTAAGVTGGRGRPRWCTVDRISHIDEDDGEIWLQLHTGNLAVPVEMTDGSVEDRHLVPVPISAVAPFDHPHHPDAVLPLLCKGGEKMLKQSKRGADYLKGLAKRDKAAAKQAKGKKPAAAVARPDIVEIDGEDVAVFRVMPQPTSGVKLPKGAITTLPNGGVFRGPQAEDKAKNAARRISVAAAKAARA